MVTFITFSLLSPLVIPDKLVAQNSLILTGDVFIYLYFHSLT